MAQQPLMLTGANGASYPYWLGSGLLEKDLPGFVHQQGYVRAAVVTNDTIAPLYGEALAARLPGGFLISLPDGETHKTLQSVQAIYEQLLANQADRHTVLIALGGGVIGDTAGFAAASFMRGLPLIQGPTSLLAMVDASIGGKTGVNLPEGKNLVGAFYDPLAVFADTSTLATLPPVEFRAGLAEVVKAALIGDRDLFEHLEQHGPQPTIEIIRRSAAVKAAIVAQDPLEQGQRALLNLGHTFGHALEQASGYTLHHGEAVAIGILAAARLSAELGLCNENLAGRIGRLLEKLELPTRYSKLSPQSVLDAMQRDKKQQDGTTQFVLFDHDEAVMITGDVPLAAVLKVLESLRG